MPLQCQAVPAILRLMGVIHNKTDHPDCAPQRIGTAGIAVCLFMLDFAGLGRVPLVDPDEPVYGQVAKEMAAGGSWLTPHLGGRMWFDKPPLFYWLSAASVKAFGLNEFACRLPSAVMAIGLLLFVYWLVKHDFSRRAAVLACLALATCLQTIVLAHAAVTDMTLAFCLTGSLYAYRRWLDAVKGARFGWMAACGAFAGLGMLTKGPVAPVLLGTTFIIHLFWTGREAARVGRCRARSRGAGAGGTAVVCGDVRSAWAGLCAGLSGCE